MEIRRIDIQNFRGIKSLTWNIPAGRRFLALIGPGDSTKSTILTAIDMTLSDRWNLSFTDTDFYQADVTNPISIRVTLTGLPPDLRQHDVLGLHLSGLDVTGELHQDPEDDHEVCVTICLTVDGELEPKWTVFRPGKGADEATVSSATRRLIGTYKVDERIDAHLRWTKTSALGRLTETKHGATTLLVTANRTARAAVAASIPDELGQLAKSIQDKMHDLGSGEFGSLQPGLDQSLSSSSGNLALYEGAVPLTNYGLGSRRLAGIAAQQLAHNGKAFLLVDEIEYGLEPHRLINLLAQLRRTDVPGQVFVTTHSPIVLRHLDAADLAVVRSLADGRVEVKCLAAGDEDIQKLLRASPEAFLARRIAIGEGKTEFGLLLGLLDQWDAEAAVNGTPVSAALGVVAVEGSGSETVTRGEILDDLGYEVTLLMDSDVDAVNVKADAFAARPGAAVVRWRDNFNLERALCEVLDADGLTALIQLGIELSENPEDGATNFLTHLKNFGLPRELTSLVVGDWISSGYALPEARDLVARVASKKSWFKQVHRGRALASHLMAARHLHDSDELAKVNAIRTAIFDPRPTSVKQGNASKGETVS
ncbi:ATP-dependent nuclease [Rhodococcus ruber]|uniref:ATP-dependent nuclease n=1 Tax=Rhodococcus ruber TaxID=1830 RepID=UPI00209C3EA0|nr:ATP-binding protein [Rhodococcus ruber]